jgi:photosystem II stability/assembly factor-like uncharacterized protein
MKNIFVVLMSIYLMINSYGQQLELIGPPGASNGVSEIKINRFDSDLIFSITNGGGFFKFNKNTEAIFTELKDYPIQKLLIPDNTDKIFFGDYYYGYFMSNNGGKNWVKIISDPNSDKYLQSNPKNSNIIFAKKNKNELWRSDDKGANWYKLVDLDEEIISFDIYEQDTSIIYLAAFTKLYKSTNSGLTWVNKCFLPRASDMIINPLNQNIIYIRAGGILYKSLNGGESIFKILYPGVAVSKLSCTDTSVLYAGVGYTLEAGGMPSGIYKSTNGGIEWEAKMNGIDTSVTSYGSPATAIEIDPTNHQIVYAGIYNKGIFKTTDGGDNWFLTNITFMPATYLAIDKNDLNFINAGNGGWGIMKTNDGGKNWFSPDFDIKPEAINAVNKSFDFNPNNKQIGYLAGTNYLYKTTDGGDTWIHSAQITGESIKTVFYHPYKPGTIIAGCTSSRYYLSTDSGKTWTNNGLIIPNNARFTKANDSLFYFKGSKSVAGSNYDWFVGKSTDFGKSFIECQNGLLKDNETNTYRDINDIQVNINNADVVYCGQKALYKSKGALSKSIDGGENWFRVDTALGKIDNCISISCIYMDNKNNGRIYLGLSSHGEPFTSDFSNGGLYLTEDDCKTWRSVYKGEVNGIYSDEGSPAYIYFSTYYGVMRFLDTLSVTGIIEKEQNVINNFQLLQNFPNPFNPTTTIKYTLPTESKVDLIIYDIMGREVRTLVNGYNGIGYKEVIWDGKNNEGQQVSSGIYFCRLKATSLKDLQAFEKSVKLMLVK